MSGEPKTPVAVLVSGRGSNAMALIGAAADPAYPARICAVLSDTADAAALAKAAAMDVPAQAVPRKDFASRDAFEEALSEAITASGAQVVCLAGFMRILSGRFVARWDGRILNIHPSLLPAFTGLHTHARALQTGVKIHGATVHVVTAALDDGPIIAQAAVPVHPGDTADSLGARVLAAEHRLYPAALAHYLAKAVGKAPQTTMFNPDLSPPTA
ncbi:MAG: phosphoribosylglycinamide formyltransferase [Pseudomonadota bacterium]